MSPDEEIIFWDRLAAPETAFKVALLGGLLEKCEKFLTPPTVDIYRHTRAVKIAAS